MRTLISITAALIAAAPAAALEPQPFYQLAQAQPRRNQAPDVIFVPTPREVVAEILRLASVRKGDGPYALRSGDARIPVATTTTIVTRPAAMPIHPGRIKEATA